MIPAATLAALCRAWCERRVTAAWERGRRVHGFWVGNDRLARVGLPPGSPVTEYRWEIDLPGHAAGAEPTLRRAKAAAEAALRRALRGE